MAISVDRVYQTVLALANKEQRGYITPQEYNLFANHAQNEIFEQYFYDLNQFLRIPSNKTVTSDPRDIIEEKISMFRKVNQLSGTNFPGDFYRLESVKIGELHGQFYVAEEVTKREYDMYEASSLTKPPVNRPIFYRTEYGITYSPYNDDNTVTMDYIRKPKKPNWTYVVINGKAVWNPSDVSGKQDFELHDSEEKNLVIKILQLAGVAIKDFNISQLAGQKEVGYVQQEKA